MAKLHDTSDLLLYQLDGCPFCIRVNGVLRELGVKLAMKDWMNDADREELLAGGGKTQVPCLRITHPDGPTRWMYESEEIAEYLRHRFSSAAH